MMSALFACTVTFPSSMTGCASATMKKMNISRKRALRARRVIIFVFTRSRLKTSSLKYAALASRWVSRK